MSQVNTSNVQSGYGSPLHQQHQQLQSLVQQSSQFYLHDPHQQQQMPQAQYQQSQPQHHIPPQHHQIQPQPMQMAPQPQSQRRTWGQTTSQPHPQDLRTWGDM